VWERSGSASPANRGRILRRRRIRPVSPRPRTDGACSQPLAGGERAETYMMRSPCKGRATGCARARAFAGPQHERLSSQCSQEFCQLPSQKREQWLGTARKKVVISRKNTWRDVVLRGSLLRARWRWWGRPRVGGGEQRDPYRNAGSAGTRLGRQEGALLRRDGRGGFERAMSIRRRQCARRARTDTALETRHSARGAAWTTQTSTRTQLPFDHPRPRPCFGVVRNRNEAGDALRSRNRRPGIPGPTRRRRRRKPRGNKTRCSKAWRGR